ncbi:uncharacterized protein RHO25_002200 [Cercospora beticola]|uniref:FAD-binding domain-containing protein n=1 Tax=Cercospora beticola TaxID=122368 RepID=A0ABZ0NDK7_CERBT|nr:hypothetical protein RHO25_002200 [Cercospora beticola]
MRRENEMLQSGIDQFEAKDQTLAAKSLAQKSVCISIWEPFPIPNEAWNGRIALVGDAGHAMSFHRGQGLNHGIADALKLVEALVEVELGVMTHKEAVLEYEKVMIYRAGQEVKISKLNTEMMQDWEKFMASPFMERGGDKKED